MRLYGLLPRMCEPACLSLAFDPSGTEAARLAEENRSLSCVAANTSPALDPRSRGHPAPPPSPTHDACRSIDRSAVLYRHALLITIGQVVR